MLNAHCFYNTDMFADIYIFYKLQMTGRWHITDIRLGNIHLYLKPMALQIMRYWDVGCHQVAADLYIAMQPSNSAIIS